jgi:hypothetical protein
MIASAAPDPKAAVRAFTRVIQVTTLNPYAHYRGRFADFPDENTIELSGVTKEGPPRGSGDQTTTVWTPLAGNQRFPWDPNLVIML